MLSIEGSDVDGWEGEGVKVKPVKETSMQMLENVLC